MIGMIVHQDFKWTTWINNVNFGVPVVTVVISTSSRGRGYTIVSPILRQMIRGDEQQFR